MSLRRFKNNLLKAKNTVSKNISNAVDTISETAHKLIDSDIDLEGAKEELINDLEKGIRIFDEIGLPQEVGDKFQEEIAEFAIEKLEAAFNQLKDNKE